MNTYEKKYKEALSKAKDMLSYKEVRREDMEYLFPELAESEDEKIRKKLIDFLQETIDNVGKSPNIWTMSNAKKWIAWLEKQGEQKPTIKMKTPEESLGIDSDTYNKIVDECIYGEQKPDDKAEPKFHKGEWIVWQDKCYKVNYDGCGYELIDQNGLSTSLEYGTIDENAHFWDITKDAKDGDVLVSRSPFIYGEQCPYGGLDWCTDKFIKASNFIFTDSPVHPATKAQRDALMKAMTDAGYTFDFEKKELKKKEQDTCNTQLTEFEDAIKDMMNDYRDAIGDDDATVEEVKKHSAYLQSLISQNPAWSEEDTFKVQRICKYLDEAKKYYADIIEVKDCIDWLKSLKYRN